MLLRLGGASLLGSSSWLAIGGAERARASEVTLRQTVAESGLEDWQLADYEAMRDDGPRTAAYDAAIKRRLATLGSDTVVVDIGTGSLALLAIMAARAGARKVYAIEKNPAAAKQAKEVVAKEKLDGKIQVIEGDSMQVELPEKVDLIVSELIGSIATQEGVEPIIRDASARFLKSDLPDLPGVSSPRMIPARCQTAIAPVKYSEHRIMSFAKKRGGIMSRGKAEPGTLRPLRLKNTTRDLIFLASPQYLEDFDYTSPSATPRQATQTLTFDIPSSKANDAKDFSGFAMWTRVVVDDKEVVDVQTQKSKSHWAYVVLLMSEQPSAVLPGPLKLTTTVNYDASPVRYDFEATAVA